MTGHKTHKCSSHEVCIKTSSGASYEMLGEAGFRSAISSKRKIFGWPLAGAYTKAAEELDHS